MTALIWTAGIFGGLLLVLFLVYLLFLIRPRQATKPDAALLCPYAHRGLHDETHPENSLAAFSHACEREFGIELDVQLSHDGEVMVFHDYSLLRMTGCDRRLGDLALDALRDLRLAGSDEQIPTLSEVLRLVNGRVPLLVELKGESTDTALCPKVAALLKGYNGIYCIESFNPILVRGMKKLLPNAFCGLLYTNVCREKKKHDPLNLALTAMALNFLAIPDFISYNQTDRFSLPVRLAAGLYRAPCFVWTVRTPEDLTNATENRECPIFEGEGAPWKK